MDLPPVMKLTLTGRGNEHYVGTLYLHNASIQQVQQQQQQQIDPDDRVVDPLLPGTRDYGIAYQYGGAHGLQPRSHPVIGGGHGGGSEKYFPPRINDPTGATYYVVAVVLVYGFSIVLLIASHIKRKNAKALEDRQINKYLQEFQVVRETSSRDRYRKLKRDITAKLDRKPGPSMGISAMVVGVGGANGGSGGGTAGNPYVAYRSLTKSALLPMAAVALPTIRETPGSAIAKRTLSDPQPPRCASALGSCLAPPNPHLPGLAVTVSGPGPGNGYGNAVRPCQRPWAAALPMRSWRSDDSNFAMRALVTAGMEGRRSTTGDMEAQQRRQQRTGSESEDGVEYETTEPRQTKVFVRTLQSSCSPSTTTISSMEATVIPIIISAPEETTTENRSSSIEDDCCSLSTAQQQSPYRRSSCPNPLLLQRGVASFPTTSSSTVDEKPFSASSLQVAAPSSSRRPSLQYSASVSRKRRRDNWLGAHNDLQQYKKEPQNDSCTLHTHQQLQPNPRFTQRRPSVQSQISCDGVIDEEPEVSVVVTTNAEATDRPQHRLQTPLTSSLTSPLTSSSMSGLEYRRKSTSAIGDRPPSITAAAATIVPCRRTTTLDVPDPFSLVLRTNAGAAVTDGGSLAAPSPLDRDSGMSIATGSSQSIVL